MNARTAGRVGQRKERWETCQAARKRIFDTRKEADGALEKTQLARIRGDTRRTEAAVYECGLPKGCGKWHLTSWEQENG
jgi:hypothetical protein